MDECKLPTLTEGQWDCDIWENLRSVIISGNYTDGEKDAFVKWIASCWPKSYDPVFKLIFDDRWETKPVIDLSAKVIIMADDAGKLLPEQAERIAVLCFWHLLKQDTKVIPLLFAVRKHITVIINYMVHWLSGDNQEQVADIFRRNSDLKVEDELMALEQDMETRLKKLRYAICQSARSQWFTPRYEGEETILDEVCETLFIEAPANTRLMDGRIILQYNSWRNLSPWACQPLAYCFSRTVKKANISSQQKVLSLLYAARRVLARILGINACDDAPQQMEDVGLAVDALLRTSLSISADLPDGDCFL